METTRVLYVYLHKVTEAILHDYCVQLQYYVRHLNYFYMSAFFLFPIIKYITSHANKSYIALCPPILYRLYYRWLHYILHYPKMWSTKAEVFLKQLVKSSLFSKNSFSFMPVVCRIFSQDIYSSREWERVSLDSCDFSLFQLYTETVKTNSEYYNYSAALGNSMLTLSVQAVEQLCQ